MTTPHNSMLTETLIASVGVPSNANRTDAGRDAAIVVFEHQPIVQTKSSFKKSIAPPHCLAASATHVFAAQQTKAVVHVYNREKGSQEATVPFPERVTCIGLACANTVLILATCEGRIFLWETASGRQIHTSQAHLQSVTALAVDSSSNFFVSVSADSTAQVWSLPSLLSFDTDVNARSPTLAFSSHRAPVVDVALGHSKSHQNFAATISEDKTCFLWNYLDGTPLATILLAHIPVAIQLDAADRALYVAYDDGSLQQIDLYDRVGKKSSMAKSNGLSTRQPGDDRRWRATDDSHGAILSMATSFDSTLILTGHASGAVLVWDVATGHVRALALHPSIPGPVTNLLLCSITDTKSHGVHTPVIVKPKFGASEEDSITMPLGYTMQLHFTQPTDAVKTEFTRALFSPVIPQNMLESGLAELSHWAQPSQGHGNGTAAESTDDYMALDDPRDNAQAELINENTELKRQLASLRQVQMATFDRMDRLTAERKALLLREQERLANPQPQEANEGQD